MKRNADGMTPYNLRNGIASAPQFETTRVSFVSRTVVNTYMKRNIIKLMERKCGNSDRCIGKKEEDFVVDDVVSSEDPPLVCTTFFLWIGRIGPLYSPPPLGIPNTNSKYFGFSCEQWLKLYL